MAKTTDRQGTEYVALPKGVIDTLSGDEPVTDEEMAFDEFVSGMSAERMGELRVGKIKVAKDGTPVANTRSAHCFSCPIDQFTYSGLVEHIRGRHGAGLYRVVGVETGKRGLVFNRLLEIAEELNPQRPGQESALQNPNNIFESVAKIMAESQARTEAMIARLSENRAPAVAPVDPMTMMTQMAGLFSSIMGVVPKPPAGDDILSSLEKLAKVKELLGSFSGDGGGGSGAEANFYDVVKTGLQSFGPALAALAMKTAAQHAPAPAQLAAPTPGYQPIPPVQGIPPVQTQQGAPAMDSFKQQIGILVQNAKMGADPMQLAGKILDLTPDEKLDDLADMIEAPDMVDKMVAINPEVQNYRAFFDKLKAALLSLLMEDEGPTLPADSQPAAGGSGAPTA
jgi:hypothetical protein